MATLKGLLEKGGCHNQAKNRAAAEHQPAAHHGERPAGSGHRPWVQCSAHPPSLSWTPQTACMPGVVAMTMRLGLHALPHASLWCSDAQIQIGCPPDVC